MIFLLLSFLSISDTSGIDSIQEYNYDIWHRGKIIGYVYAKKFTQNGSTYYLSKSNSTTEALISINVISTTESFMEQGLLKSAEANVMVRGRPYAHSYTYFCDNQCEMARDGSNVMYIDQDINYTSTMLIFQEPNNVSYSYSELDGNFHEIKSISAHQFKKIDHKGRTNSYLYEDGILLEAEIDAGLISFKMIRRRE